MPKVDILIATNGDASLQDLENSNGVATSPTQAIQQKGNGNLVVRSVFANRLVQAGIDTAKRGINYAKSNYGNFTGDYIKQQKIDTAFSIAGGLVETGMSIAMGFAVNPAVGAAVAVVKGIDMLFTGITNEITYNLNLSKANRQANFNSQRIGSILTNGNR